MLAQTIERKARRDENAAQWLGKVLHRLHTRIGAGQFLIAKESEALKAEIDAVSRCASTVARRWHRLWRYAIVR